MLARVYINQSYWLTGGQLVKINQNFQAICGQINVLYKYR